jgi:hypothetical protein
MALRMNWQGRILVLVMIGLPAFTGISPLIGLGAALPGVPWSAFVYAAVVNLAVVLICGRPFAASALAVSVLILLPVVMGGAVISCSLAWLGTARPEYAGGHGAHYVRLALNMLSVIPLALGIVATLPLGRLEHYLLRDPRGVTLWEKKLLMAVRVFNHIAFFVIPNLLEVVREEQFFLPSPLNRMRMGSSKSLRVLTTGLVQIGVAGICTALRFIPLWAREIADLPDRKPTSNRSSR